MFTLASGNEMECRRIPYHRAVIECFNFSVGMTGGHVEKTRLRIDRPQMAAYIILGYLMNDDVVYLGVVDELRCIRDIPGVLLPESARTAEGENGIVMGINLHNRTSLLPLKYDYVQVRDRVLGTRSVELSEP